MEQILARAVFLPRLSTTLLALLALAALVLAALGIYGVLSSSVTERTREIGLPMALGSTSRQTVGLVVHNSLLLVAMGAVLGSWAATILARSGRAFCTASVRSTGAAFAAAAVLLFAGISASVLRMAGDAMSTAKPRPPVP